MEREKPNTDETTEREPADDRRDFDDTEDRPVPGVKHKSEPDAENIMPAEDRPGTL